MDELEKTLFEKYGTKTIAPEEIQEILKKAGRNGLIEQKDIRPQPPMDATSLMEHISHLRRLFLINDGFTLNSSGDDDREDSYGATYTDKTRDNLLAEDKPNGDKVMDKVLKAYFEYEKMHMLPEKSRKTAMLSGFAIGCLAVLFLMYTPEPY